MSNNDKDLLEPVIEPDSEKAYKIARAALSCVPVLGGALVEAFNALIISPIERRKTEWMELVTEAINELYQKGVVTEVDLQESEKFFTTLVHASNLAIMNHEKEGLQTNLWVASIPIGDEVAATPAK